MLLLYQENVNASVGPELLVVTERGTGSTGAIQNIRYSGGKNEEDAHLFTLFALASG